MISGAIAIACYISSNPSPLEWMVSGPKAEVQAVERVVSAAPGAEIVDRASGSDLDFARFRVPATIRYGDFMGMMNAAWRPRILMSSPTPVIPNCAPNGRADDIDDPYASAVVVGLFGDADNLAHLREQNPWATFSSVVRADGRSGLAFQPSGGQIAQYEAFVAAAGKYPNIEMVLLSMPSSKPR
jgi:hypothetical protein